MMKALPFLIFGALCALSILLWWPSLADTLRLALARDAYTHILLILPLSVALIYADSTMPSARPIWRDVRLSPGLGGPLLALALVVWNYVQWGMPYATEDVHLSLAMLAIVAWWIGSFIFCFGMPAFHQLQFPLYLLFLIVPVPESVLRTMIEFLQLESANTTRVLFHALGVPATQDGILVSIPGLVIEVAKECSSIRSSMMLLVTTIILAGLFLRSPWRRLLLVLAAIPLSVFKNAVRIVTITLLATRIDPGYFEGRLHHQGGILFFGVAVVGIILLLLLLRRSETHGARLANPVANSRESA
jgi:exosortase